MEFHGCSRQHPVSIKNIPDDILPNIFIRLPAKQLAQMRCLSKSWNAFFSESSFIKSHLHLSIQNNKDRTLLVFPKSFSFTSTPFIARHSRSPHLEIPNFIKLPVNPQANSSLGKVIGSVNGLICFRYGSDHHSKHLYRSIHHSAFIYGSNQEPELIYIWNPSLSALLTLPPYYMPSHSIQQIYRFGFDPKTDDYKVVRITRRLLTSPNTIVYMEWLPVEVYSMRKGSWKLTTQRIPSQLQYISNSDDLCVDGHDGHLHWVVGNSVFPDHVDRILAFDLGTERFHEITLPDSLTGDNVNKVWITLGVLAGKLCVIPLTLQDRECVVWVMDEYGVAESWVKHHVFPPFSGFDLHPYGFTVHNEFLFKVYHRVLGCDHALYDPVDAKTKIFKLGGDNDKFKVVDYIDSLVWVTPAEQHGRSCCSISQFQN